jgi:hypothetical protein
MKTNPYLSSGAVLISALLLTACSPDPEATATATNPLAAVQLLETKPENAIAVRLAKTNLQPGDPATVFGQIGGIGQPFLESYAGFVLGDTDIDFCNELHAGACPTPWDACCVEQEDLQASRASVAFVDAAGNVITQSIKGFGGLTELDEVVVTGTVAPTSTPDNLIIEATGIYREPAPSPQS